MDFIIDFIGRNLDIGAYIAGVPVIGFIIKALVEKFVSQSKVDAWFDNLNANFGNFLLRLTPAICAVFENTGIFVTKFMSGKIGKAIWNNTLEPILIWVIEGAFGLVIVLVSWLATLPGAILKALFKGFRSDNNNYTPLNGK